MKPLAETLPAVGRCRLCTCRLAPSDNHQTLVCTECSQRPEARRLGAPTAAAANKPPARQFTAAEKSLIRKLHGYMPAKQLLDLLNERLLADLGPDATRYSGEQLDAELRGLPAAAGTKNDWASLRQLLARARSAGVLGGVGMQTVDDFAVVFSLTPAQVLHVKDVILGAQGDGA